MTPKEDGLRNHQSYLDSLLAAARELSEQLGNSYSRKRTKR